MRFHCYNVRHLILLGLAGDNAHFFQIDPTSSDLRHPCLSAFYRLRYIVNTNICTHPAETGATIPQQECEYDSVDVSSRVRDVTVKKHGVFCGTQKPSSITSEGNVLRVGF